MRKDKVELERSDFLDKGVGRSKVRIGYFFKDLGGKWSDGREGRYVKSREVIIRDIV